MSIYHSRTTTQTRNILLLSANPKGTSQLRLSRWVEKFITMSLRYSQISLEQLLSLAPTEEGIFSDHLRQQLWHLQHNSQLELGYKKVVKTNAPVRLDAEVGFKLHSLGLVKLSGNDCVPSCNLYRQYFSERLG